MSQIDRRRFIQRAGGGAAAAGAVWAAPAVLGRNRAFAAGSDDGGTGGTDGGTDGGPPTTVAPPAPCQVFDWGKQTSTTVPSPLASDVSGGTTLTTTNSFAGTSPPTVPSSYRNFEINTRPFSGAGSISGYGDNTTQAGLVLIQNNASNSNPNAGAIANYQELVFSFSEPVTKLTFTVYDLSATGIEGTNAGYNDAIGFDKIPVVLNDTASARPGGASRTGDGSFADPFRRQSNQDYFVSTANPANNVRLDVTLQFAGPLSSLTMRYSTVAGRSQQFVKIGDMTVGDCARPLPNGW